MPAGGRRRRMSARDVKTTVVATAFCGLLAGAVLSVFGVVWVAVGLVALGVWLAWDETRRARS